MLDAFNDLFLTCLNDHAPVKTVKLRHKLLAIRDVMKARDRTHKRAKRTRSEEEWGAFRELRKEVKVALRKAEQDYLNQEIASNKNNSWAIWKIIRSTLPKKSRRMHYTRNTDIL